MDVLEWTSLCFGRFRAKVSLTHDLPPYKLPDTAATTADTIIRERSSPQLPYNIKNCPSAYDYLKYKVLGNVPQHQGPASCN